MPDVFSVEKRSQIMACVRSTNTKPELFVRSMLHGLGYRFTVNGPKNRDLPGRPDIVLPRLKCVVFVHGCFWHGHGACREASLPTSRQEYWKKKIEGNINRDERNRQSLESLGWNVVSVWTCSLRSRVERQNLLEQLPGLLTVS